ncbi:unnamed protein product [Amoebophrya sp. A25]|nr:unnamed protein product [Amoebophrya sp. A25]|eukprot:GSA25T00018333001.1
MPSVDVGKTTSAQIQEDLGGRGSRRGARGGEMPESNAAPTRTLMHGLSLDVSAEHQGQHSTDKDKIDKMTAQKDEVMTDRWTTKPPKNVGEDRNRDSRAKKPTTTGNDSRQRLQPPSNISGEQPRQQLEREEHQQHQGGGSTTIKRDRTTSDHGDDHVDVELPPASSAAARAAASRSTLAGGEREQHAGLALPPPSKRGRIYNTASRLDEEKENMSSSILVPNHPSTPNQQNQQGQRNTAASTEQRKRVSLPPGVTTTKSHNSSNFHNTSTNNTNTNMIKEVDSDGETSKEANRVQLLPRPKGWWDPNPPARLGKVVKVNPKDPNCKKLLILTEFGDRFTLDWKDIADPMIDFQSFCLQGGLQVAGRLESSSGHTASGVLAPPPPLGSAGHTTMTSSSSGPPGGASTINNSGQGAKVDIINTTSTATATATTSNVATSQLQDALEHPQNYTPAKISQLRGVNVIAFWTTMDGTKVDLTRDIWMVEVPDLGYNQAMEEGTSEQEAIELRNRFPHKYLPFPQLFPSDAIAIVIKLTRENLAFARRPSQNENIFFHMNTTRKFSRGNGLQVWDAVCCRVHMSSRSKPQAGHPCWRVLQCGTDHKVSNVALVWKALRQEDDENERQHRSKRDPHRVNLPPIEFPRTVREWEALKSKEAQARVLQQQQHAAKLEQQEGSSRQYHSGPGGGDKENRPPAQGTLLQHGDSRKRSTKAPEHYRGANGYHGANSDRSLQAAETTNISTSSTSSKNLVLPSSRTSQNGGRLPPSSNKYSDHERRVEQDQLDRMTSNNNQNNFYMGAGAPGGAGPPGLPPPAGYMASSQSTKLLRLDTCRLDTARRSSREREKPHYVKYPADSRPDSRHRGSASGAASGTGGYNSRRTGSTGGQQHLLLGGASRSDGKYRSSQASLPPLSSARSTAASSTQSSSSLLAKANFLISASEFTGEEKLRLLNQLLQQPSGPNERPDGERMLSSLSSMVAMGGTGGLDPLPRMSSRSRGGRGNTTSSRYGEVDTADHQLPRSLYNHPPGSSGRGGEIVRGRGDMTTRHMASAHGTRGGTTDEDLYRSKSSASYGGAPPTSSRAAASSRDRGTGERGRGGERSRSRRRGRDDRDKGRSSKETTKSQMTAEMHQRNRKERGRLAEERDRALDPRVRQPVSEVIVGLLTSKQTPDGEHTAIVVRSKPDGAASSAPEKSFVFIENKVVNMYKLQSDDFVGVSVVKNAEGHLLVDALKPIWRLVRTGEEEASNSVPEKFGEYVGFVYKRSEKGVCFIFSKELLEVYDEDPFVHSCVVKRTKLKVGDDVSFRIGTDHGSVVGNKSSTPNPLISGNFWIRCRDGGPLQVDARNNLDLIEATISGKTNTMPPGVQARAAERRRGKERERQEAGRGIVRYPGVKRPGE